MAKRKTARKMRTKKATRRKLQVHPPKVKKHVLTDHPQEEHHPKLKLHPLPTQWVDQWLDKERNHQLHPKNLVRR